MTREELERRLEAAEKVQNLKEKLAEQDKQEIPDLPNFECGESYWTMFDNFALSDERTAVARGATGYNRFHTEDYAQKFAEKCKLIAMMLHCKWYLDRDYVPDFTDLLEEKHFLFYDNVDGCFKVIIGCNCNNGSVSFSTEEAAQKCAEWMNEHWKEV